MDVGFLVQVIGKSGVHSITCMISYEDSPIGSDPSVWPAYSHGSYLELQPQDLPSALAKQKSREEEAANSILLLG